jgi:hypothetical protein
LIHSTAKNKNKKERERETDKDTEREKVGIKSVKATQRTVVKLS